MPGKMPSEQDLIYFIVQTHEAEHQPVDIGEVQHTLAIRRGQANGATNPFAMGHFDAFNYLFKSMVATQDFPCKDSSLLVNQYESHTALYWLRELHTAAMYPIASQLLQMGMGLEANTIKTYECGVYRVRPKQLAFSIAPEPEQIQPLLHLWLRDIANFHDQIKDKISNPYGLSRAEAEQLIAKSEEACLFLSCLQPFEDGNNRIARLVENALRVKWYLPWKSCMKQEQIKTMDKLTAYQMDGMKKWIRQL